MHTVIYIICRQAGMLWNCLESLRVVCVGGAQGHSQRRAGVWAVLVGAGMGVGLMSKGGGRRRFGLTCFAQHVMILPCDCVCDCDIVAALRHCKEWKRQSGTGVPTSPVGVQHHLPTALLGRSLLSRVCPHSGTPMTSIVKTAPSVHLSGYATQLDTGTRLQSHPPKSSKCPTRVMRLSPLRALRLCPQQHYNNHSSSLA